MSPIPPARTRTLFPAIIQRREMGDTPLNSALYDLIKGMQNDDRTADRGEADELTTVGGYQPDLVLHEALTEHPLWQQFTSELVHPAIQAYMKQHSKIAGWPAPGSLYHFGGSWAVLYPALAYQAPHIHRDVFCVFTYYARVPVRPQPEGGLTFINPHLESTFPYKRGWRYDETLYPKNGTNILFPGWLQHYSHPHQGDDERLIITIDVQITPASDVDA